MTRDIGKLIERVEAATEPDRELDHAIYEALRPENFGALQAMYDAGDVDGYWFWMNPKAYTGSIDAAVALAEKVGDAQMLLDEAMGDLSTTGWHPDRPFGVQLARYLLLALLRSLQSEEPSNG